MVAENTHFVVTCTARIQNAPVLLIPRKLLANTHVDLAEHADIQLVCIRKDATKVNTVRNLLRVVVSSKWLKIS